LLVAGGSGVVPFPLDPASPPGDREHGAAPGGAVDIRYALTREQPKKWRGYRRRIDRELLEEIAWPPGERPLVCVCGPTAVVETAASTLVALGHEPSRIRTERLGPTGG
jgi:ferredoxin-NADP reductase